MKLVALMSFLLFLPLCSSRSVESHDETKPTISGRPTRPPPPNRDEIKPTSWFVPPGPNQKKPTGWGIPMRPPPPSHDEIKPNSWFVPPGPNQKKLTSWFVPPGPNQK
ncbi:proline-rich protein HaeIII subfamily 1-like [Capsella rubella]|uniref:proline-rich protein HaeIII subfamily 1-like n=1 Tax=Capsella rubella TaxID=81985 RepID=UPI000CD532D5|nr:proline-rich protein HaeIII subfamily 1-like [Capsella rubella]